MSAEVGELVDVDTDANVASSEVLRLVVSTGNDELVK